MSEAVETPVIEVPKVGSPEAKEAWETYRNHLEPPLKPAAQPVPEVKPAEPVKPESKTADDSDPSNQEQKPNRFSERISDLTKARKEAERRAEIAEQKLAESSAAKPESANQQPPVAKQPEGRPVKPKLADFADYNEYDAADDKYIDDLTDWKLNQFKKQTAEENAQRTAQEAERAQMREFQERIKAAAIPDFEAKISASEAPVTDFMKAAIFESAVGPELAIYWADNPDEAEAFGHLGQLSAMRELVTLEAKLAKKEPEAVPETPKPRPVPPKPPTQVRGQAPVAATPQDAVAKGDFAEYSRRMNQKQYRG